MPTEALPWLEAAAHSSVPPGDRFRALLRRADILRIPGAHNGLSALQARAAGFESLYLSGAAMSASMGTPDVGLITPEEVAFFVRQIARAADLPLLVDGDTGHGGPLNMMQFVRLMEESGAAAIHVEDQLLPKKCGHLNDKQLIARDEMAAKVAAAVRARRHLVIVARTDAVAVEGIGAAIDRARAYRDAGADAIFPEALTSEAMYAEFAAALPGVPLLANMTEFGRSPDLTADRLQQLGFAMVIWPVSSLRVASKAQEELYAELARAGTTRALRDRMQTRSELYALIGLAAFEALDRTIMASSLPPAAAE
ncbi:MAG: methylisocitrate lyase [Sphingomonadales bacterium]|nr:methylisocitrate lyase [Sphingomonadales bacterium]